MQADDMHRPVQLLQAGGWSMQRKQYERLLAAARPDAQRWVCCMPLVHYMSCSLSAASYVAQEAPRSAIKHCHQPLLLPAEWLSWLSCMA